MLPWILGYGPEHLLALIDFGDDLSKCYPEKEHNEVFMLSWGGSEEEGKGIFQPLLDLGPLGAATCMMFNKYPRGPDERHLIGGRSAEAMSNGFHSNIY